MPTPFFEIETDTSLSNYAGSRQETKFYSSTNTIKFQSNHSSDNLTVGVGDEKQSL
jgi:hypothetical protein